MGVCTHLGVGGKVQMIRSELLQALATDNPDLRPEEIEQVVSIFFDEIAKRLAEGGRVELRGRPCKAHRPRAEHPLRFLQPRLPRPSRDP